ncbi:AraC family transcriptional regulator [Lacticaseibacillus kribbianus]|uniref:AraC family transcriptional regulator n=1 Tax=Lacticaseibacillus kribbianus TaxID=2926292 RepID=UPI001CD4D063|nr:AraC family transcriptional regulator [Lacticaseibacillus kribbianus]
MFFFEHYGLATAVPFKRHELHDHDFPRHFHRAFELMTVAAGALDVTIGQATRRLTAGQAALVFPNQPHGFTSPGQNRFAVTIFAPELVPDFAQAHAQQAPTDFCLTGADLAHPLGFATPLAQKAWLYQVLAQFDTPARAYRGEQPSSEQRLLYQVLAYIEAHYQGDCGLRGCAQALGYDYSYLSRTFSHQLGLSYTAYVQSFRLTKATQLLTATADPVAAVASQAGFGSLHAFNQAFRRRLGETPSAYRAQGGAART